MVKRTHLYSIGMYKFNNMSSLLLLTGIITFTYFCCDIAIAQACPKELSRCQSCAPEKIECIDTGYRSTEPLTYADKNVRDIYFTGNMLQNLTSNILGECQKVGQPQFKNLLKLDLSVNNIEHISGRSFHCMPELRVLLLNNNKWNPGNHSRVFSNLKKLQVLDLNNAFEDTISSDTKANKLVNIFNGSHLTSLEELRLANNEFYIISDDFMRSLANLVRLDTVDLTNNKIIDFDLDKDWVPALKYLYLQNNSFSVVANDLRDVFDAIAKEQPDFEVNLEDNPFNCDCGLKDFVTWLKGTHIVADKLKLKCFDGYPESNIQKALVDINVDDLECKPYDDLDSHIAPAYIVLGVLILCIAVLLLGCLVHRNYSTILRCVRNYRQAPLTTNSFNYASVDEAQVV